MRLVCPNCDAQYAVDDNAIPEAGRDVQCSNCGHAWFQLPAGQAEAEEAEEALFGAVKAAVMAEEPVRQPRIVPNASQLPPEIIPPRDSAPDHPPHESEVAEKAPDPVVPPAPPPTPPSRAIDDSLLAVLREEAEREAAQRRNEPPRPMETQTELGLEETAGGAGGLARSVKERLARLRGEPAAVLPEITEKPASRRDLLPDIEEINSTLRATSENRAGEDSLPEIAPPEVERKGFTSGFSLILLVFVVLIVAYVGAPQIVRQLPATEGPMRSYVAAVDTLRGGVDALMQSATQGLQSLTGKE